jgi:hypothetical protein
VLVRGKQFWFCIELFLHKHIPSYLDIMCLIYTLTDMKKTFKQWLSTIPSVSTKRTLTTHLNTLNIIRPRHINLEIHVLGTGRKMWIPPLFSWQLDLQRQAIKNKPAQIRFHTKKRHYHTTFKDNIKMKSTMARSMNARS